MLIFTSLLLLHPHMNVLRHNIYYLNVSPSILNGQGKMKVLSLIFLTTVILCTLSHSLCAPVFQLGKEWHAWKAGNGKVYESDMDELERHLIWLSNMKYIEGHNANQGMFGYALSMNQYGDIVSIAALHTCI